MIQLSQISKVVEQGGENIPILKDIDLKLTKGDFLSIMGPSGSGKSSLLHILGLLDEPGFGSYLFDGLDVRKLSGNRMSEFRSQRIGFVFQAFMLIPRLTVRENVEVPLLYTSLSKKERRWRVDQALDQVGMQHKAQEHVVKLSGGQKQKTAIARAMINRPDVLLTDEPTGNLDAVSKDEIMSIFKELNQSGMTIVLVTHDQEVAEYAQNILYMKNGEWMDAR